MQPKSPTLQVVDDDFHVRIQLEKWLNRAGYQVQLAASAEDALEQVRTSLPDLFLIDVQMPQVSGFELYKTLQQNAQWSEIPVVFLTDNEQRQDLEEGLALGVQDYVFKPLAQNELRKVLAEKLGDTQATRPHSGERYQIEMPLGQGGAARVYRAWDSEGDALVALKKWPLPSGLQLAEQKLLLNTFQREAQTLQKLNHPALVQVLDAYADAEACYLVMEFLPGQPLDQWLKKPELTLRQFLELLVQTAEALHHAHEQGLTHRDIKPENIRVDTQGRPHLTDFEITAFADRAARQAEPMLGSLTYLSPEQLQASALIDARSDIYSLGAVIYHVLTGQICFDGATVAERIERMFLGDLDLPHMLNPRVHIGLSACICQALCLDLDQRYENMAAFQKVLQQLLDVISPEVLSQPFSDVLDS